MNRNEAAKKIEDIGIVPCARVTLPKQARFAAETLCAAGIPVLEITLTFPGAEDAIAEIAKHHSDMVVGAGTVLDEEAARRCVNAGARFITSPGLVPSVVAFARKAEVVVFPGALTPSEIIAAWHAGADFVKIFPASMAGGAHYVRTLKVPLPQVPLIVTGGVNQLTAFDYILAGASAIGVGGELLPHDAVANHHGDRIHELARRFLAMVKEARAQRNGSA